MAVRHHVRVLVVDDDPSVSLLLKDQGYVPQPFGDPEQAFQAAEIESFPVAVVDLDLPGVGIRTVEKLKAIDLRLACIATSAKPRLEDVVQAMRDGACDYLPKPFTKRELIEALERACRRVGIVYIDDTELNRLIGQRVRSHRLNQNLTLRELSDQTDLTTSQLSQVELGKNGASIWALARISNALGLQVSELLEGL